MSNIIATDVQLLEQDALVEMYELDVTRFGEGILRFTPGPADEAPVEFGGYKYYPVPIEAEGFKYDGNGTLPSPTLTLSAMDPTLSSLIRNADDLLGSPVKRIRTYRKYLDDGDSPDSQATYPIEEYEIERKTKQNSILVEFELAVSFDQRGKKIPGRQVIRDTCPYTYRLWQSGGFVYHNVSCPYAGGRYYMPNGDRTFFPEEDTCGKRLSDCQLRFGNGNLPFGGFPGAGRL